MLEKKIENKIIEKLSSALDSQVLEGCQIMGAWSTDTQKEETTAKLIVTVKVRPRAYETYTIPTASFEVEISILARADVDYNGESYLAITEYLLGVIHAWQRDIDQTCADFDIEGEFSTAGARMNGGDVGLMQEAKVWTCTQSLTLYGTIL